MIDKVFIAYSEPEVALVLWLVRVSPTTKLIQDEPEMVCDHYNKRLDWEPFAVIDLPSEEQLRDPEYVLIGSRTLCQACAKELYHLTRDDVCKVDRIEYYSAMNCIKHRIG